MVSSSPLPDASSQSLPPRRRWAILAGRRLWIGLLVSALWLAVMTALWLRESGRMGAGLRRMGVAPEVLLVSWLDYDQWLWIEQNGRRIGLNYMSIRLREPDANPGAMPGYTTRAHTRLNLKLLGFELPIDLFLHAEVNPAFELKTLDAAIQAAGQHGLLQAFVEGARLYYRVKMGSAPEGPGAASPSLPQLLPPRDVCGWAPLAAPVLLDDSVIPILSRAETLKPGAHWTTWAADPFQGLRPTPVQIRVEAKETLAVGTETIETWRLSERQGDLRSNVWYDPRGRVVRRDLPESGLSLIQANPSQALAADRTFDRLYKYPDLDRTWIKRHLDPKLSGVGLGQLLPGLPAL